jgi:hypothetical protein
LTVMQTDITSIVFKERCAFNARAKQWQGELVRPRNWVSSASLRDAAGGALIGH